MTMKSIRELILCALALSVAAMAVIPASQAQSEETEIRAFAAVRGKGTGMKIADNMAMFVGTVEGALFVDGGEGPLKAGTIVCSASVELKTVDRSENGSGRCLISAEGGEVFAQYSCSGYFLVGCSGGFTLTGGTGRFAGISGGGTMIMRTSVGTLGGGTPVSQGIEVEGIVFWRDFKYRLS